MSASIFNILKKKYCQCYVLISNELTLDSLLFYLFGVYQDFAKDTSDTSTHSDNSYSRLDDFVEFEVVSESEVEANPLGEVGELSSGAEVQ